MRDEVRRTWIESHGESISDQIHNLARSIKAEEVDGAEMNRELLRIHEELEMIRELSAPLQNGG